MTILIVTVRMLSSLKKLSKYEMLKKVMQKAKKDLGKFFNDFIFTNEALETLIPEEKFSTI